MTLIERISIILDEAKHHPGVVHYLRTHQVAYHGQVGRFRVYSAELTKTPTGVIHDLSDGKPNRLLRPSATGDAARGRTHAWGRAAKDQAKAADDHLTRLGFKSSNLTLVVTRNAHRERSGRDASSQTSTFHADSAFYSPVMHHAALSADEEGIGAGTIAHEWVHHYQANLPNPEQKRLHQEFVNARHRPDAFARDYGRKNWAEWQATGVDAEVKHKSLYPRTQGTPMAPGAKLFIPDRASPRTVKKLLP